MNYTKLSDLVGQEIYIESVGGYNFKKWDAENKQMLKSDKWQEGFSKVYWITTDKGTLDIRAGQLGQMFESVSSDGRSTITGRTFKVNSNGKTGIDIRYYINPVFEAKQPEAKQPEEETNDLPF